MVVVRSRHGRNSCVGLRDGSGSVFYPPRSPNASPLPKSSFLSSKVAVLYSFLIACIFASGCATQQHVAKLPEIAPLAAQTQLKHRAPLPLAQRKRLAVLDFEDRTDYGYGRIGRSAADVLTTFLFRSGQFNLYDREKLNHLMAAGNLKGAKSDNVHTAVSVGKMAGVDFVAIGAVTSFGYHTTRSQALFLGSSVKQEAEATVDVRIVEVATGRVVAAESGRGVAFSNTGEVLGVGTSAGYDERLCGDALRVAISQFVDKLIDQSLLAK